MCEKDRVNANNAGLNLRAEECSHIQTKDTPGRFFVGNNLSLTLPGSPMAKNIEQTIDKKTPARNGRFLNRT